MDGDLADAVGEAVLELRLQHPITAGELSVLFASLYPGIPWPRRGRPAPAGVQMVREGRVLAAGDEISDTDLVTLVEANDAKHTEGGHSG